MFGVLKGEGQMVSRRRGFVVVAVLAALGAALPFMRNAQATVPSFTKHDTTFDAIAPAWQQGSPPVGGYQSYPSSTCGATGEGFSDPQWVLVGDTFGAPFDPAKDKVTTLEGQVTSGKLASDDNPIDHHSRDRNFFVFPDPSSAKLLATPGNFVTGEENEHGRIEVEVESAAFPAWAQPTMGDRVHVEGSWIWDCAHGPFRTEIHPPRLVMTLRDAADQAWTKPCATGPNCVDGTVTIPARPGWADAMPGLGSTPIPVTRADVFASSDGGEAREQLTCFAPAACSPADWYQPLKAKSYDLFVPAPPKPDPDAELVTQLIPHPFLACDSDDAPCGQPLDVLAAQPGRFTFTEEPVGNGTGIHIHVDFGGFTEPASHLYGFGFTYEVGWNRSAASASKRVKVTVLGVHIANTMDIDADDDGEFEISALIGDRFRHMILTGPDVEVGNHHLDVPNSSEISVGDYGVQNGGSACALHSDSHADPGPCQTSFEVTLLPGQALRVFFRAEEQDPANTNDEGGTVERITTAAQNYGISATPYTDWFQERTSAGVDALDSGFGSNCAANPCLSITYKIEDDPFPVPPATTISTGAPVVVQGGEAWVTSGSPLTLHATPPNGHPNDALDIHARFWRIGSPAPSESVCGSGTGTAACTLHLNANDGFDGVYAIEYWTVDATSGAIEATQSKEFRVDNTPPTTFALLSGTFLRGWYRSPVTVTLFATDGAGVGVDHTTYIVDGGPFNTYLAPFVVTGDSPAHVVSFASADKLGNAEPLQGAQFQLDATPPTLAVSDASDGTFSYSQDELVNGIFTNAFVIHLTYASADALSGMWEVRVDGTPIPFTGTTYIALPSGISTHSLVAEDTAGNLTALTFTVVSVTIPDGTPVDPQGAGYWKTTAADLSTFLAEVNVVSRAFGAPTNRYADVTLANYQSFLTPGPNPTPNQQVARDLLSAWLNLLAGREPAAETIDLKSVKEWPNVVKNTGGSSITTALNLLRESERRLEQNPSPALLATIQTLLDKLNNAKLN
jgi:hypothetical protein